MIVALLGVAAPISGADPALKGTIFRESFTTPSVGEPIRYELYLPPGHSDGSGLPYLLFLPGYKDDGTYCRRKGFFAQTERMIENREIMPMAIVCLDRGRGIWIDAYASDLKYERALVEDLPRHLATHHRVLQAERTRRGILGISIGGFAALKIVLRHPDLFGSVSALSPALDPGYAERVRTGNPPWKVRGEKDRLRLYGPTFDVDRQLAEDPFWLLHQAPSPPAIEFFLACGVDDRHHLAGPVGDFMTRLQIKRARVEGNFLNGNHDLSFWLQVYPQALRFHSKHFEPAAPCGGAVKDEFPLDVAD